MFTLGINATCHDCSACLVRDGEVLAAAEEERFTRIKHGKRPVPFSTWQLPCHAIDYGQREGGIALADVQHVAASLQCVLEETVLINTSFNTRGEPVVCSPRDAVESFFTTPLDALAIGPFIVEKV